MESVLKALIERPWGLVIVAVIVGFYAIGRWSLGEGDAEKREEVRSRMLKDMQTKLDQQSVDLRRLTALIEAQQAEPDEIESVASTVNP